MLAELSHSVQSVWDRGGFYGQTNRKRTTAILYRVESILLCLRPCKTVQLPFFLVLFIQPDIPVLSCRPFRAVKKTAFPLSVLRSARASLVLHRSHHTRLADTVHPSAIIVPGGARGGVGAP